jgi:hypothetical protein
MEFLKGFLLFSELLSELVADFLFFLGLLWLLVEVFLNLHASDTAEFIRKYRLMMFVGIPLILVVGTQADHIALLTLINTGNFTGTPPYAIFAVILFVGLLLFLGHLVWKAGQPVHSLWITSGFLVIMIAIIILVNRSPKKIAYPFPNHTSTTSQVAAVHTSTPTPTSTSTATVTPHPTATSTSTRTPTSMPTKTPDPCANITITSPTDKDIIFANENDKKQEIKGGAPKRLEEKDKIVLISCDKRNGEFRYWAEDRIISQTDESWTGNVFLYKKWSQSESPFQLYISVYYDEKGLLDDTTFDGKTIVSSSIIENLSKCVVITVNVKGADE